MIEGKAPLSQNWSR